VAGQQGPAGVSGYQIVYGEPTDYDVEDWKTASVSCPTGKRLISLSFDWEWQGGFGRPVVKAVTPSLDGTSGTVEALGDGRTQWDLRAVAICATA
jgi:hypothetical protein